MNTRWKSSRAIFVLVAVLVGVQLTGAVAIASSSGSNVLRMALKYADIRSLDPHYGTTTPDRIVVDMIFNALVRYAPGNIDPDAIEPDLATEIPTPVVLTDGRQEWVFMLREGILFHPLGGATSTELTAEDVVYSLTKAADPQRSAYSGEYRGMVFEAVGRYTVRIILAAPLSPALFLPKVANYSGGYIVSKSAVESMGDQAFKTNPVGTGPFMFGAYKAMEEITLVAFADYFRGRPALDGVAVKFMPDATSRELGLRSGALDVIELPTDQTWADRVSALPGTRVDVFGPGEIMWINFNLSKPPFNSLLVRQAVAYALDRQTFVDFLGSDVSSPVYSIVPEGYLAGALTAAEVDAAGLLFEVDRARSIDLLRQAGYSNGFRVDVITSDSITYRTCYDLVQNQLQAVGIQLEVRIVEHSTYHSMIRDDLSSFVIYGAWRPNADAFLTRFFHSDSIVKTGPKPDTNFSHYDAIDQEIVDARVALDPAVQESLWKDAQLKILQNMAAYTLYMIKYVYGVMERVDWGYELQSSLTTGPQVTERTRLVD